MQGIYPVLIVLLVHSQKSYIDDATETLASLPRFRTNDGSPRSVRFYWNTVTQPEAERTMSEGQHDCDVEGRHSPPKGATTFSEGTTTMVSTAELALVPECKDNSDQLATARIS